VGEEGLDIGDVDLIISYDCLASPVRMVQRLGRTGRAGKGRVIILIT
jgi:Fanconi anemia group M protein